MPTLKKGSKRLLLGNPQFVIFKPGAKFIGNYGSSPGPGPPPGGSGGGPGGGGITIPMNWTHLDDLSFTVRTYMTSFIINDIGYLGTGTLESPRTYYSDFYKYDPATAALTGIKDHPIAKYGATSFVINGIGYVGAGRDSVGPRKDFYKYDPGNDAWTEIKELLGIARIWPTSFVINGIGYVGLGTPVNLVDFYKYTPGTDTWTQIADFLGSGRHGSFGFTYNSEGYVGLGMNANGTEYYSDIYKYSPGTNTWTQLNDFPGTARAHSISFMINNIFYMGMGLFSGTETGNTTREFWKYDPTTDVWTQLDLFLGPARHGAIGFVVGNRGYGGTGLSGITHYNDLWQYMP